MEFGFYPTLITLLLASSSSVVSPFSPSITHSLALSLIAENSPVSQIIPTTTLFFPRDSLHGRELQDKIFGAIVGFYL